MPSPTDKDIKIPIKYLREDCNNCKTFSLIQWIKTNPKIQKYLKEILNG